MTKRKCHLYPDNFLSLEIKKAKGVFLFDQNNKKYIDFSSSAGVVNIGYDNAQIKKTIIRQLSKQIFIPQWSRGTEAEKLSAEIFNLLPREFNALLRAVTGSEAVEIALQLAITRTGKKQILSFKDSYHGHTIASGQLGLDNSTDAFNQSYPVFKTIEHPYWEKNNAGGKITLRKIEEEIKKGDCAAVISEGFTTNAGCLPFPAGFWPVLAKLCQCHDVILIFDEVLTGFGRTGKMFSFQHHDIVPDVICLSKGLSSGYAAIAAVVTKNEIAKNFSYFSTFAWSPMACAIAAENIRILNRRHLTEKSSILGIFALKYLQKNLKKNYLVREIRGLGLEIAIEFSREHLAKRIFDSSFKKGVILFKNDRPRLLFIQPPLSIDKKTLKKGLDIIISSINK